MTFDDIKIKTIRAAQNLQALGFVRDQVFGILARNSHDLAPIVFASIAIGCPVQTLDPSFGRTELVHILKLTEPVLMFCDIDCYELLNQCLIELGIAAKLYTIGGTKGRSELVESLFKVTHKEDQFM